MRIRNCYSKLKGRTRFAIGFMLGSIWAFKTVEWGDQILDSWVGGIKKGYST